VEILHPRLVTVKSSGTAQRPLLLARAPPHSPARSHSARARTPAPTNDYQLVTCSTFAVAIQQPSASLTIEIAAHYTQNCHADLCRHCG
jgi:hypothetical protein